MTDRSWQHIWMAQCDAAEGIRGRHGPKAAFDYAVGEELLHEAVDVIKALIFNGLGIHWRT